MQIKELTDYKFVNYPEQKDPFNNILKSFGDEASIYFTKKQLGADYKYYEMIRRASMNTGIQARMMWDMEMK